MASKFSTGSINLTRIDKDKLFTGKNGDKWVNIIVWHNDTPDEFNNDGAIQQSASKEIRESGWKAPYLGNYKNHKNDKLTKEEQDALKW